MLKRFLAEALATMRLRHERIIATHNVFSKHGTYYIVMECVAGNALEARLRDQGPLPVAQAVQVAAEVYEGPAYAHERIIGHCDLKSANVLFDKQRHAKVADFGIAHVSGEMLTRAWKTPQGFVASTLPYMSPEKADGVRDDRRIDACGVGAVL
jgi:serine/threonine protein kinase